MAWRRTTGPKPTGSHRVRLWLIRTGLIAVGLILALLLAELGYVLSLPSVANAEARVLENIRSHHGEVGGLPVPSRLGRAVVAVEDEHFYSPVVVNVFDGFARAALASVTANGDPGGSTIDQQLAKELYAEGPGWGALLRDVGLGVKLAVSYSRSQILAMYLNVVYYGNHYWGDVAAAKGYFGLAPNHLSWAQAAMLAGLPQAPSAYDPVHHLALAKERQLHVLNQLVANHDLTRAQARPAYRLPLKLRAKTTASAH